MAPIVIEIVRFIIQTEEAMVATLPPEDVVKMTELKEYNSVMKNNP